MEDYSKESISCILCKAVLHFPQHKPQPQIRYYNHLFQDHNVMFEGKRVIELTLQTQYPDLATTKTVVKKQLKDAGSQYTLNDLKKNRIVQINDSLNDYPKTPGVLDNEQTATNSEEKKVTDDLETPIVSNNIKTKFFILDDGNVIPNHRQSKIEPRSLTRTDIDNLTSAENNVEELSQACKQWMKRLAWEVLTCQICDKRFHSMDLFEKHLWAMHHLKLAMYQEEYPFQRQKQLLECQLCKQKTQRQYLLAHISDVHHCKVNQYFTDFVENKPGETDLVLRGECSNMLQKNIENRVNDRCMMSESAKRFIDKQDAPKPGCSSSKPEKVVPIKMHSPFFQSQQTSEKYENHSTKRESKLPIHYPPNTSAISYNKEKRGHQVPYESTTCISKNTFVDSNTEKIPFEPKRRDENIKYPSENPSVPITTNEIKSDEEVLDIVKIENETNYKNSLNGFKTFACDFCDLSFNNQISLQQHKKRNHKEEIESQQVGINKSSNVDMIHTIQNTINQMHQPKPEKNNNAYHETNTEASAKRDEPHTLPVMVKLEELDSPVVENNGFKKYHTVENIYSNDIRFPDINECKDDIKLPGRIEDYVTKEYGFQNGHNNGEVPLCKKFDEKESPILSFKNQAFVTKRDRIELPKTPCKNFRPNNHSLDDGSISDDMAILDEFVVNNITCTCGETDEFGRRVGYKRKLRCNKCKACLAPNCNNCDPCRKPSMKKACIDRTCFFPRIPNCPCFSKQGKVKESLEEKDGFLEKSKEISFSKRDKPNESLDDLIKSRKRKLSIDCRDYSEEGDSLETKLKLFQQRELNDAFQSYNTKNVLHQPSVPPKTDVHTMNIISKDDKKELDLSEEELIETDEGLPDLD